MSDIAARIRERLDLNGHEDWCPAVIHKSCCDGQCECATGGLVSALRAVLGIPHYDLTRPTGHLVDDAQRRAWNRALDRAQQVIAAALSIPTDPPARDDTTSTVAGSHPSRAGVPTEDGAA